MSTGIILTGGNGSRLANITGCVNKHLISLNGKFIIDYPLTTLKNMGVTELIVVLGGSHFHQIVTYLKDGKEWGFDISYVYQDKPQGIAQAINLCKKHIKSNFTVILGDNIFENSIEFENSNSAQIMLASHPSLQRFGVATLDSSKSIYKIEEKPKEIDMSATNLVISGCYRFTPEFFDYFKEISPSNRGEFEVTSIIQKYLDNKNLNYSIVNGLWSDAGTHESLGYLNHYFYAKEHGIVQV